MADFEFQRGVEMAKEMDIPQLLAQIYGEYARMLASKGDVAKARGLFEEAREIWVEMGNTCRGTEIQDEIDSLG